jgi:rubrerythrin
MPSVKGTETEKNLLKAFAGESQARNRYTYAAQVARDEGYLQIADLFMETAENEREHAKRFWSFLDGAEGLEITAMYPAGKTASTADNLRAAAAGEHEEWTELYPQFAEVAKREGFPQVAAAFSMIARVEKEHEARYQKLLEAVEQGTVFKKEAPALWKCRNCGYIAEGLEPPAKCPACLVDRKEFELKADNY